MEEDSGAAGEELAALADDEPGAPADEHEENTEGDEDAGAAGDEAAAAEGECAEQCLPRRPKSKHRFAPFGDFADFRKKHKLERGQRIFIGL